MIAENSLTEPYFHEDPCSVAPIEPVGGECSALCETALTGEAFVCSLEIGHDGPCQTWDEDGEILVASGQRPEG